MREAKEEALRLQEAIAAALQDEDDNYSDVAPVRHTVFMAVFFLFCFCACYQIGGIEWCCCPSLCLSVTKTAVCMWNDP